MKKFKLRNLIRESIKDLLNEQGFVNMPTTQPGYTFDPHIRKVKVKTCGADPAIDGIFPCYGVGDICDWSGLKCDGFNCEGRVGDHFKFEPQPQNYPGKFLYFELLNVEPKDVPAYCGASGCDAISDSCPNVNPPVSCDNTMNGSCAQQWLPSNMNWPNMVNFACTGNQTYSGVQSNQYNGAMNLLTNNGFTGTIPNINNYQDISNFVNGTGITGPVRAQIKRKLAKSYWGDCMKTECNC